MMHGPGAADSAVLLDAIARSDDVPHAWLAASVAPDRWRAYALEHARRLAQASTLIGVPGAAVLWRTLPWDSRLLRVPSARIDSIVPMSADASPAASAAAYERAVAASVAASRRAGATYLVSRVATHRNAAIAALEGHAFQLVDGILTFGLIVADAPPRMPATPASPTFVIREASPADADAVSSIAAQVYTTDRFHNDPRLDPRDADELYREWARNACTGAAADVVWVAERDGELLGFTTASFDAPSREVLGLPVLTIGLVGTAPAARRQGVASALALHACIEGARRGAAAIEVGTQLRNIAASRTYESAGFRLVASSLTFRHWAT